MVFFVKKMPLFYICEYLKIDYSAKCTHLFWDKKKYIRNYISKHFISGQKYVYPRDVDSHGKVFALTDIPAILLYELIQLTALE